MAAYSGWEELGTALVDVVDIEKARWFSKQELLQVNLAVAAKARRLDSRQRSSRALTRQMPPRQGDVSSRLSNQPEQIPTVRLSVVTTDTLFGF